MLIQELTHKKRKLIDFTKGAFFFGKPDNLHVFFLQSRPKKDTFFHQTIGPELKSSTTISIYHCSRVHFSRFVCLLPKSSCFTRVERMLIACSFVFHVPQSVAHLFLLPLCRSVYLPFLLSFYAKSHFDFYIIDYHFFHCISFLLFFFNNKKKVHQKITSIDFAEKERKKR